MKNTKQANIKQITFSFGSFFFNASTFYKKIQATFSRAFLFIIDVFSVLLMLMQNVQWQKNDQDRDFTAHENDSQRALKSCFSTYRVV
jgi:hypothetical protein